MTSCFVVLHFLKETLHTTYSCVDNLLNLRDPVEITIVDNGSNDGSFEALQMMYGSVSSVHYLRLDTNTGFASGNNLGCDFSARIRDFDFYICINNDIIIKQIDFIEIIYRVHAKYPFDVLGPRIRNLDNSVSNPQTNLIDSYEKALRVLENDKAQIRHKGNFTGFQKFLFWKTKYFKNVLKALLNKAPNVDKRKILSDYEIHNIGLHGSALVFSKKYYRRFGNVFYPGTFLYREEDFLFNRCMQNNLISIYLPSLYVDHIGCVTAKLVNKASGIENFGLIERIRSTELLADLLKNDVRI